MHATGGGGCLLRPSECVRVTSQSTRKEVDLVLQLILAVGLMLSSWAAWRRNPMYSARHTVRTAAIVLLAIAGAVVLIISAVNLARNASPGVAACIMVVTIVVDTLALIFIIQAVTVPKESRPAALPHSVRLVTTNRRKIYIWLKVLGVLVLAFALGGLVPGVVRIISLTLGGMTLFLAVILLPVFYYSSRGLDQSLTATELNPWVHWQYAPEQWQQWAGVQADRLRATPATFVLQRDWRRFLFPFAIIVGGVAFFSPGSWLFKALYLAVVLGAILSLVTLSGRGGAHAAEKLHAKLLAAEPEAYFGHDGVFCDGVFTPWLNVSIYLISAEIDERQPRSLLLQFERSVPNPYGTNQVIPIHQSVPIPANAGGDLDRLQRELTARCPTAKIALV